MCDNRGLIPDVNRWLLGVIAMLGACLWGCMSSPPGCVTGMAVACACAGGASGAQVCGPGNTYGPCDCRQGLGDATMSADTTSALDVVGANDGPTLDHSRDAPPRDGEVDATSMDGTTSDGPPRDAPSDATLDATADVALPDDVVRDRAEPSDLVDSGVVDAGVVDSGVTVSVTEVTPTVDPSTAGSLRLITPLSTTVVTSRRPTLRWGPMPSDARAHVTLCADSSCARVLAEFDAAGASVRPATALRPGPVFWSVRVTPAMGSVWQSPTWEFFVTPHDSAVDTTRCCVDDVNRDGVPDFESKLIGRARVDAPYLADGSAWSAGVVVSAGAGYAPTAWTLTTREIVAPDMTSCLLGQTLVRQDERAIGLRYLADTDGDGFGDLGLALEEHATCSTGARSSSWDYAAVAHVAGGGAGLRLAHVISIRGGNCDACGTHADAALAGDVNGDGFADLGWEDNNFGSVVLGVAAGFGVSLHPREVPARRSNTIVAFAVGLDADGDRLTDFVTAHPPVGSSATVVDVEVDTATRTTDWFWPPESAGGSVTSPTWAFERLGDLDGDGYEDLALRYTTATGLAPAFARILRGGPGGYTPDRALPADATWAPPGITDPLLDVNGDGITDRLVWSATGAAALYLGSVSGYVRGAALPYCAGAAGAMPTCGSRSYFSAGDFDRDGYSDLYVWDAARSALEVFAGGPSGFGASPIYSVVLPPS